MRNDMHIVLSADDNYARPLAVTLTSVLCNRAEGDALFFHVLDGGITNSNKQKLYRLIKKFSSTLNFISVQDQIFSGLDLRILSDSHVTQAAYYRILLPSLLPEERCIYMDCDMICRASLAPLWNIPLGNCPVAAVRDIDADKHSLRLGLSQYFNSGLLLMNLEAMRKEKIQEQCLQFMRKHPDRIVMHDQDVLNCVLSGRIHELDMTWNCQVAKTHKCKETGFHALSRTANILHFIGHKKPWMWNCRAPGRIVYWKYSITNQVLIIFTNLYYSIK